MASVIMDAGNDDQQPALALHQALINNRTRTIAKSSRFKLDRIEAMPFHFDQLQKNGGSQVFHVKKDIRPRDIKVRHYPVVACIRKIMSTLFQAPGLEWKSAIGSVFG
jgi:hypothetical protein